MNAQTETDETEPTSEWEHSHALNAGDEIEALDEQYTITAVNDDGSIDVESNDTEYAATWVEEQVTASLSRGTIVRVSDGKSHELATF